MERYISHIHALTQKLLSMLTPQETYRTVISHIMSVIPSRYGVILMHEDGCFKQVYSSRYNRNPVTPRKRGFAYHVYKTSRPIVVPVDKIKTTHPETRNRNMGKSTAFIPIKYKRRTVGVIVLVTDIPDKTLKGKLDLLSAYGTVASLAIKKSLLYRDLEDAVRMRDIFISVANHELKTPLTSIMAYAELIHRMVHAEKVPPDSIIERLLREAKRQNDLLNELLAVDQIRRGELTFDMQKCCLVDIITTAKQLLEMRTSLHPVLFRNGLHSGTACVNGDKNKLIQLFTNILNNAAKFSPPQSPIEMDIRKDTERYEVTVTDHGQGIAKADLPHIYDLFYRGDHQRTSGMGIGLFLAKQTIDAHEGMIKVTTREKAGTTFKVILPVFGKHADRTIQ